MSNKILNCECGICLDNLQTMCLDESIQLECTHYFHCKCIKEWCMKCIDDRNEPTCPTCRQKISNEYLDILNIDFYSNCSDVLNIDFIMMYIVYH